MNRESTVLIDASGVTPVVMVPLSLSIPASTKMLAPCREMISAWLRSVERPDERWPLIATELVVNAIEATVDGRPAGKASIHIEMAADTDHVWLAVENPGIPLTPIPSAATNDMPDENSRRGRGLAIVEALSDRIDVHHRDGSTLVRCVVFDTSDA